MATFSLTRLGSDPQLVARLPYASFYDHIGIETPTHFADIDGHSLELERRRPRYHLQSRNVREQVDDFFADPVAKVVLLRVGTNIHERQHGNGCNARGDGGVDFQGLVLRLWIQPEKDGDVTSRPKADQDGVISPRASVIFLQFRSKAASLHTYSRIDIGIVLGVAIEDFHCDREFFEIVEISVDGPIHDVREEAA